MFSFSLILFYLTILCVQASYKVFPDSMINKIENRREENKLGEKLGSTKNSKV